jgi:beta-lactamase superfamily II metal-dependent hydrolase
MKIQSNISFLQVGNGACAVLQIDGTTIVFDLNNIEGKTTWETLKPHLRVENGRWILDVLCISHGDGDHCCGFRELMEQVKAGRLIIGSIWHPNYDRAKVCDDLPEDYLALHKEILRRRGVTNRQFGDVEVALTAWDEHGRIFEGLREPSGLLVRVLSPYVKDQDDMGWDVNDISLVLNITVEGLSILFPGDSTSCIWQERIIPHTLSDDAKKDWARAHILPAAHHGSWSFFGSTRDAVRDADPLPENYSALDYIAPEFLVISSDSRFPTSQDCSGDRPPHYAAWKWYHKWFRDNRSVGENDLHPRRWKYSAQGHIRLELAETGEWQFIEDWVAPEVPVEEQKAASDAKGRVAATGFVYHGGETRREKGHYA